MRTGLDHLPAVKRRELERVARVLFDEFEDAVKTKLSDKRKGGRILKLILFGSYARGDWVEDRASGYISDYDLLVVVNADKIRVTGNKANDKVYYRHSGFPGGIYGTKFKDMQAKHPGRALEKAVKGMLPKGPLGYAMVKKLKVYAGATHPHTAQQPKQLDI